ncbi:hypothetical protein FB385_1926 [Paramicrobacterium agarici]|uniref:Uncharacterized protein n=1 Tax=Paramicrobacterium agarici TaxID=630514 RepID=A0A2A9DV96_9MICO|nr:hypothetical protein ATJ78_0995 [Microbacterium agarici]TQO23081.1 hypothetical protein FB385_1926 [Microbacterium agarici]
MYPAPMAMAPEVQAVVERERLKPPGWVIQAHRHWRRSRRRMRKAARTS